MSLAWEITIEDIAIALIRHNSDRNPEQVFDEQFVGDTDHCGRVEQAVLAYTDFDDQCDAALAEIENILLEVGVLQPSP